MEKLYKFLKILIVILLAAVLVAAVIRLLPKNAQTPQPAEDAAVPDIAVETTQPQQEELQVPDFTVYDADGTAYKLSDFLGKPVILNFWASWCGPCKAEMPDIEESYKTYGDKIHFLIVNLTDGSSETVETASTYIAEQGYTFPVYYDTAMEAAYTYGISAIPATYFIDAQGNLIHQQVGMMNAETLQQAIDLLLS